MGEDKITYLGISYGTFLGATYANLFPDTVRAMVFDGNVSPDAWTNNDRAAATESINTRIGSDVSITSTLQDLLTLCGPTSTDKCAFSADPPTRPCRSGPPCSRACNSSRPRSARRARKRP